MSFFITTPNQPTQFTRAYAASSGRLSLCRASDVLRCAEFADKATGDPITKLKLSFAVTSGKHVGTTFDDLFTDLVSPGSKLGNLLEAFSGGGELPDDGAEEIDLAEFIGSEASVRIEPKPSGYLGLVSGSAEPVEDAPNF